MTFEKLGPILQEVRTPAICEICKNYIYKRVYYDEASKEKKKTIFVCKNCLDNNNGKKK